ncbi:MAG: RDD family protein [Gammaproteobacteria bacterium]|jgi:uncharacterized RDD family membrane protein YckC
MAHTEQDTCYPPAGLLRRLVAMFYDSLLLLSALLVATAVAMLLTRGTLSYHNPWYRTALFLIWFSFYAWFWLHGGQTLGMRAWRLRVQSVDGGPINLWQALLRFMVAIPSLALGGLGFFWMLVDPHRMTLYDRFSESVMVVLPKSR